MNTVDRALARLLGILRIRRTILRLLFIIRFFSFIQRKTNKNSFLPTKNVHVFNVGIASNISNDYDDESTYIS